MGANSKIEWTHHTFNPWWGCAKVSPGCDHCYAERDAGRYIPSMKLWGVGAERRVFGDAHWTEPLKWNRNAAQMQTRFRVFCASMADVFDKDGPAEERRRLWSLIEATPHLDWLLLSKRVGNVAKMVPARWMVDGFPPNVWLGISVVNQEEADRDIPKLLALPARVRFLSCEPLLGPIDLRFTNGLVHGEDAADRRVDWVIVGGESGPRARQMRPEWALRIRDECNTAGVAFHFKQWGEWAPDSFAHARQPRAVSLDGMVRVGKKSAGRELDGRTWDEFPRSAS